MFCEANGDESPISFSKERELKNKTPGSKFLVMKRKFGGDLQKVSPFLLKKVIDSTCGGEVELCKKTRSGFVLIKTKNVDQAKKLVQLTKISQTIVVDVTEHNFLNNSKGVIFTKELIGVPEEEILNELKIFNVIEVRKIQRRANEEMIETGLIILTFATTSPPEEIFVGYELLQIRPFIPNPLRCFNCFKFGHPTKFCRDTKKCVNCGYTHHIDIEKNEKCTLTTICTNCKIYKLDDTLHNSLDKKCPIYIREKEIQAIKTIQKVDLKTARQILNQRTCHSSTLPSQRTTTNYNSFNTFGQIIQQKEDVNNNTSLHDSPPLTQIPIIEREIADNCNSNSSPDSSQQMSPQNTSLDQAYENHCTLQSADENNSLMHSSSLNNHQEKDVCSDYSLMDDGNIPCKKTSSLNLKSNKNVKILPRKIPNRLKRQLKSKKKNIDITNNNDVNIVDDDF